jgi:hypothetical protein
MNVNLMAVKISKYYYIHDRSYIKKKIKIIH